MFELMREALRLARDMLKWAREERKAQKKRHAAIHEAYLKVLRDQKQQR